MQKSALPDVQERPTGVPLATIIGPSLLLAFISTETVCWVVTGLEGFVVGTLGSPDGGKKVSSLELARFKFVSAPRVSVPT